MSKKTFCTIVKQIAPSIGLNFARLVIPNAIAPFEDQKLCFHLTKLLMQVSDFIIKTPDYVRDIIHIELLAEIYVKQILHPNVTSYNEYRVSEYRIKIFDFAKLFISKYNRFHLNVFESIDKVV